MFIGRESELGILEKEYSKEGLGLFVLFGRRRTGKTALLKEFVKGKRCVFFTAQRGNLENNLQRLRMEAGRICDVSPNADLGEILGALSDSGERTVVIIDEYPYLASSEPSVSDQLKDFIDDNRDVSDLFLILCGSSISFMTEKVLGGKSPLFGRRTAQYKLLPLDYRESARHLEGFSDFDKMAIYGMVGGIPMYLEMFDPRLSLEANIRELFLSSACILSEEPTYLLMEEMRSPGAYSDILNAMAAGNFRLTDISKTSHTDSAQLANKMRDLALLDIVSKRYPFGEVGGRRTGYVIADNLFRFCHRFLIPYARPMTDDESDLAMKRIMAGLPSYIGTVFEDVCREYVRFTMGYDNVGTWWGTDASTHVVEEIDIVAKRSDRKGDLLFAECECRRSPVGADVSEKLRARSMLVPAAGRSYILFSCGDPVTVSGIRCIGLGDLYRRTRPVQCQMEVTGKA